MKTDKEKLLFSTRFVVPLMALNALLTEADELDIPVDVFIRKDDPVSGRRTIVYVDVFKPSA